MSSTDWGTTRRLAAHVVLAGEGLLEGDLHLLARAGHPGGPETPLEILNRAEPFFALTIERGVVFVSKAQTAFMTCRGEGSPLDPDRASAAKAVQLSVEMHGGAVHRGSATFELPPSSARPLDYVNSAGSFFALADGDAVRYVNKAFVRLVRPLE